MNKPSSAAARAGSRKPGAPNRKREAVQDLVDLRDRYYAPTLQVLHNELLPDAGPPVMDQGEEGGCTGFALATAIHMFRYNRAAREFARLGKKLKPADQQRFADETAPVSARMLYEMAKLHDEIPGADQEGATLRGALKGFYHNGVCAQILAEWTPGDKWNMEIAQSKDARKISLGAYYRLRPLMSEYHAALSETGAIIVSARIHEGWFGKNLDFDDTAPVARQGEIIREETGAGGHAFVIIGYDRKGFLIQNSWGDTWGGFKDRPAVARWSYEDWAENIMDAWVLQLGVPTPDAFHLTHTLVRPNYTIKESGGSAAQARRQDVIGHLIHFDDGKLVQKGRYGTPLVSLQQTGDYLVSTKRPPKVEDGPPPQIAREKYDHILFFVHGGLAGPEVGARRTAVMREVFKRNRIYPIHIMWETGITDTVLEALEGIYQRARDRVGDRQEELDQVVELMARGLGTKVWRAIKQDARRTFVKKSEDDPGAGTGFGAVTAIAGKLVGQRRKPYSIHVAGHSAGSILIGECLKRWFAEDTALRIANCFLLAPACTLDFYESHYLPLLKDGCITRIVQYSLSDELEHADVQGHYGKSMLNLISRAFEDKPGAALLGLQRSLEINRWQELNPGDERHEIHVSYGSRALEPATTAKAHNGFVSDITTLNDMLTRILGEAPDDNKKFTFADLVGL